VVLSRDANVSFVHASRGASTGWGGTRRLVGRVGRGAATRMLLLGEAVRGGEEAERGCAVGGRMVYADAVAAEGETALDAAMRLVVDKLMELPCPRSIRAIKRAVSSADGDRDVIDPSDGSLNVGNAAIAGEMESFRSVWGGRSNAELIQKTRDRLRGGGGAANTDAKWV
jgi:enoyl-CoA hydratase/carnithine racemase